MALGIMGFPQLFGLAVMVFLLGLILSQEWLSHLFPSASKRTRLGAAYVLYIVLVIVIIHAIEAYFLNSEAHVSKNRTPIFFTFIVLIFSEHYIGIWGLIIGIPIFVFILDILEVTNKEESS
ncbi:AI-2E family transporter [Bacillus sp. SL00103]